MAVAELRRQDEQQRDLSLAWHTAALYRTEKMPSFRELLRIPVRRQSPAEQREVLHQLSKRYGIPLREVTH